MKEWEIVYTCKRCEALLKVEKEDIETKIKRNKDLYYTFKCPCCNIENEIYSKLIPAKIKIKSLKKLSIYLKGRKLYERNKI